MPRFGKQWLDNFIQDTELQNTFLTSEVVRNIVMLQCVFYSSVYNDLMLYKHTFLLQKEQQKKNDGMNQSHQSHESDQKSLSQMLSNSFEVVGDLPAFKIGIIGCGHIGTMILTKLLEISASFNNLKIYVSTRQPHLLRPF